MPFSFKRVGVKALCELMEKIKAKYSVNLLNCFEIFYAERRSFCAKLRILDHRAKIYLFQVEHSL